MFVREVVTGQKEGRPVRYAQIVSSYRNAQGKPRHRVILSLGRVDRLDRPQLRSLVRALVRYLGEEESVLRPRVGEVRELGLPWVVHAIWSRLAMPDHLAPEAHRHGLPPGSERALFARVLGLVAGNGSLDGGRAWLESEVYPVTPDGQPLMVAADGEELLAQAGPEIERGLFLRRVLLDGRLYAAAIPHAPGRGWQAAVAFDGNGAPVVSQVARSPAALGRRLHRRLRDLGARDVVWGPLEPDDGAGSELPVGVGHGVDRIRWLLASSPPAGEGPGLERARTQLTAVLLAALVVRRLEIDADLPLEAVREHLRHVKAVELRDGDRVRWESNLVSPGASELLRRLELGAPPRELPDPRGEPSTGAQRPWPRP